MEHDGYRRIPEIKHDYLYLVNLKLLFRTEYKVFEVRRWIFVACSKSMKRDFLSVELDLLHFKSIVRPVLDTVPLFRNSKSKSTCVFPAHGEEPCGWEGWTCQSFPPLRKSAGEEANDSTYTREIGRSAAFGANESKEALLLSSLASFFRFKYSHSDDVFTFARLKSPPSTPHSKLLRSGPFVARFA